MPFRTRSRVGRVALVGALLTLGACTSSGGDSAGGASSSAGPAAVASASSATASSGEPAVPRSGVAPAVPVLAWSACPAAADGAASTAGFECSTATVPMD